MSQDKKLTLYIEGVSYSMGVLEFQRKIVNRYETQWKEVELGIRFASNQVFVHMYIKWRSRI